MKKLELVDKNSGSMMDKIAKAQDQFSLLDRVPIGVCVLQSDKTVLFWNGCLEQWTKIPRNKILGTDITEHFPHLNQPKYANRLHQIFQGGPPTIFSSQLHKYLIPSPLPHGQWRIQHTTVTSVPAFNGDGFYALLSIQDVTDLTCQVQDYRNLRDQALAEVKERQRAEAELYQTLQIKEELAATATAQAQQLEYTLHNLQKTQAQLIQTEKMSSLGRLVAGVAHEISNPVNFIHGNLPYLNKYTQSLLALIDLYQQRYSDEQKIKTLIEEVDLDFLVDDLPKIVSSMEIGVARIREIVWTLRNFSRLDEAEMKPVNIHEGIDSTLVILQNRLKARLEKYSIQIIKNYGDLPKIECYAGQLNQVFINVIGNAIDALDSYNSQRSIEEIRYDPSKIIIHTEVLNQDYISVRILDNGPGMAEEVRQQIFEPFFSTKPPGKGIGLGLSISYQIVVDKHGGLLICESVLGQGTEFQIEIPIRQSRECTNGKSCKPSLTKPKLLV